MQDYNWRREGQRKNMMLGVQMWEEKYNINIKADNYHGHLAQIMGNIFSP